MTDQSATAEVVITHDVGLHARPSVKLTKLAKKFGSRITLAIAAEGPWIDAKSIVKVMATKVPQGSMLYLRAEGNDAAAAVEAIVALVRSDFGEGADAGT